MQVSIKNLGKIVTGDTLNPLADGDTIIIKNGIIETVGSVAEKKINESDVIINANGAIAIPGFIDSHVHITFGDYTPRQNTVGFLQSYLHGGTTTCISASEVHVPGRPKDVDGVKALAIAAQKCFKNFNPGGMQVYAGSIILEPGLSQQDFIDVNKQGVWLAKAGFGNVTKATDYIEMIKNAKNAGLITTLHTGGASIPDSFPITGNDLIKINPDVAFHINGGPVSIEDKFFEIVSKETEIVMQVCTAGNLRTAILCAEMAKKHNAFERFLIATDTPTGSGIMPLGIIYTISQISSLSDFDPEILIAAATGNVSKCYGLNTGFLRSEYQGDIVIIDAPLGGTKNDGLSALKNGDPCAIGGVITAGIPRFVGKSRNTPPTISNVCIEKSEVREIFK